MNIPLSQRDPRAHLESVSNFQTRLCDDYLTLYWRIESEWVEVSGEIRILRERSNDATLLGGMFGDLHLSVKDCEKALSRDGVSSAKDDAVIEWGERGD